MSLAFPLDHRHDLSPDAVRSLVGGKAANLGVMAVELGLPVPPGFVITTEACRAFLADGWPPALDAAIRAGMAGIETALGRRFGDPADPLLVSVRSGAPVSMPGMMDTILDLGVTAATEGGLARRAAGQTARESGLDGASAASAARAARAAGEAFARDCRSRLRQMFRDVVGADEPPDDPWDQLRLAIEAVFRSWNGDRARAYRRREGIADDLGTAATVQAMVFGNRDERSATGVLFTRNPATGEPTAYGDVLFGAQGEDVVAGTHRTEPLAALDERMPDAARELRDHARRLEHHFADLCDIEFTIESGRLWLLQVRVGKRSPAAALRIALEMAGDPGFPLSREAAVRRVAPLLGRPPVATLAREPRIVPLTIGLPASPGVATGEVVTSPEAAERAATDGRAVILVRAQTSPEDVHGMAKAAGILTASGGIASHAAVVARGWGIPAVVGAAGVAVHPGGFAVAGREIAGGQVITIDGGTGEVFLGRVVATTAVVPAARTLLDWAGELGIPIGEPDERADAIATAGAAPRPDAAPAPTPDAAPLDGATPEACLHAIGIKGFATADAVADAVGATPAVARATLQRLVVDGLALAPGGAFRLSERGAERHRAMVDLERAAVGQERAGAWLDAFSALDQRLKETVTAWQVRAATPGVRPGSGAETVLNDHADPDYDRGVLEVLVSVVADASAWLAGIEASSPRFGAYRRRLGRAVEKALAGDGRFVASPRVDSCHGIWFELHEDLILLSGRTRADEVAAGRA